MVPSFSGVDTALFKMTVNAVERWIFNDGDGKKWHISLCRPQPCNDCALIDP